MITVETKDAADCERQIAFLRAGLPMLFADRNAPDLTRGARQLYRRLIRQRVERLRLLATIRMAYEFDKPQSLAIADFERYGHLAAWNCH